MIGLSPLWLAALGERADVYGRQFLLDASTGLVLPGFAYTRSGPALWLPQQDGSLASFAADVLPRSFGVGGWGYEFHPGWTQGVVNTHDLAPWGKAGIASFAQNATGPNGAADAWSVIESNVNESHYVSRGYTTVAGVSVCQMAVVGQLSGSRFAQLLMPISAGFTENVSTCFDLSTGARVSSAQVVSAGAVQLANGHWLIWHTAVPPSAGTASFQIRLREAFSASPAAYQGDGVSGIRIWCTNITNTTYPVPLTVATASPGTIGTHTMAATLSSLGVTLGAEYTIGMEYEVLGRIANQYPPVAQLRVGTTGGSNISSGFFVHPNGTQFAIVRDTADVYLQQSGAAGFAKSVLGVKAANFRAASNGVLAAAGSTGTPPSGLTAIQVARDGGGPSGAMRVSRLYLIPARRAPDAELAAMTA